MAKAHKEGTSTVATNGTLSTVVTVHKNADGSNQQG